MGDLTKNFSVNEFKVSATYPELARQIELTAMDQLKLFYLCSTILQPLRNRYGHPIRIARGKASKELNDKIPGSSLTTDHLFLGESCACDPYFGNTELLLKSFYYLIHNFKFAFGQLILYYNPDYTLKGLHISLPTKKHHGEVLIKDQNGNFQSIKRF